MFSQSKSSEYFSFYKGGNNYEKPTKYVLFDLARGDSKKEGGTLIYFYMEGQTFIFNSKRNKVDSCKIEFLKKITLDNPRDLQEKAYSFYKEKKLIEENKMKLKNPIPYPVSDFSSYFKIILLEKTTTGCLINYDVSWKYSSF